MIKWLWKVLTQNYCDTCGWTKRHVFVTSGFRQCNKCFSEYKGGEQ